MIFIHRFAVHSAIREAGNNTDEMEASVWRTSVWHEIADRRCPLV